MAKYRHLGNVFYTYVYLDENDQPFYVGKGHGDEDTSYFKKADNIKQKDYKSNKIRKIRRIIGKEVEIYYAVKDVCEEDAFEMEKYLISLIGRKDLHKGPLLNMTNGGDGGAGYIFTEEQKRKVTLASTGRVHSEESKRKRSEKLKGRRVLSDEQIKWNGLQRRGKKIHCNFTPEGRAAISARHKGMVVSEETRQKLRAANLGKIVSEETKQKMRDGWTPEARARLSNSLREKEYTEGQRLKNVMGHIGLKHSEDTCLKQSEGLKSYWERKRISGSTKGPETKILGGIHKFLKKYNWKGNRKGINYVYYYDWVHPNYPEYVIRTCGQTHNPLGIVKIIVNEKETDIFPESFTRYYQEVFQNILKNVA